MKLGPKALSGYSSTDNGFAKFDHIRIPKENMLSKFAQVTDDGQYIQPPHAKLSYGGVRQLSFKDKEMSSISHRCCTSVQSMISFFPEEVCSPRYFDLQHGDRCWLAYG